MYCDPPSVQKPAIRADEAVLTATERRSNENNAILDCPDTTPELKDCVTSNFITYAMVGCNELTLNVRPGSYVELFMCRI